MIKPLTTHDVNECLKFMEGLNTSIDTLTSLLNQATNEQLLPECFNASMGVELQLKKLGITDTWISETVSQLEGFRSLLYGEFVDWDEFTNLLATKK